MDTVRWAGLLADWGGGKGPRYEQLAEALRRCIRTGQLIPDELLPAERALAGLLSLSRSTVVAAYDELAATEWINRKRGSGTRVSANAPRQAQQLMSLRSPVARTLVPHDELDFTIAVPLLTEDQKTQMRAAAAEAFVESLYHPLGLLELRAHLAEQYSKEGLPTTTEQILMTSGAQQAISLVGMTFLQRGDHGLLETPTFFGAIDVFRAAGARLVGVPLREQGIIPAEFTQIVRQYSPRLAFLTPTFQNPTGTVLPALARAQIAKAIAAANLPTIEDDTLIDLGFGPKPPPRISSYDLNAPIVNVGSMSKLYWAGLRVGWMRVPEPLLGRMIQVKTLTDFGSSLPSQHIAFKLLQDLPRIKQQRQELVMVARDSLVNLLRQHLPSWSFTVPDGGQFLWVELPTRSASSFIHFAARYGLRLFPGASMGVNNLPDCYLRLPFTLDPAVLPIAVQRLKAAWEDFGGRQGEGRLA